MPRGGKRAGAGRPIGQGKYGEATSVVRVPTSMVGQIKQFAASRGMQLPLYSSRVQAGLPSTADDHIEDTVDLNTHLVQHPTETFLVHATGASMLGTGIQDGDLLIVDRSIDPKPGKIVVAAIDGQVTVKILRVREGKAFLSPANPDFPEIPVDPENGVVIWGVVTSSIQMH